MDALDSKALAIVDEKGHVCDDTRNAIFRKLRMKSENRSCFECSARNPTWNSLTYGVYLCLECSGEHRRKGVHLSFVRSVELDKFSPEQIVQMAVGGNGKAWEYFKNSGMGKTCDSGRAVDYNSKVALRYKQTIEKDTVDACRKLGITMKADRVAGVSPASQPAPESSPSTECEDFPAPNVLPARGQSAPSVLTGAAKASAAAISASVPFSVPEKQAVVTAPAPKNGGPQSTIKVLHNFPESSPPAATTMGSFAAPAPTSVNNTGIPKPSGFAAKQKAKEIDFDFDFDELEIEAAKPAPAPPPKAVAAPTPGPTAYSAPVRTQPKAAAATVSEASSKFTSAKAISSADFFHELEGETAQERRDKEERFNKYAQAGAISSSSFFGDVDEQQGQGQDSDWKSMAGRGATAARGGISKGAELLTTYLNKVRD